MSREAAPQSGHFHAVRFYENAESLTRIVAAFLAEGFVARQPGLVIATPDHRAAIVAQLVEMSFDIDLQRDLVLLDARETLDAFMVDGMPSSGRFAETLVPLLDRLAAGRDDCMIRAYGEMVDVLWKDGMEAAAVRLEMLWNQLAGTRRFSLLCGYSMGSFYKDAAFEEICSQHSHVVAQDGRSAPLRRAPTA